MADFVKCSLTSIFREIIENLSEVIKENNLMMEVHFAEDIPDEIVIHDADFADLLKKYVGGAVSRTSMGVVSVEVASKEGGDGTFAGSILVKDTSGTLADGEGFISGVEGVGNIFGFEFIFEPTDSAFAAEIFSVTEEAEEIIAETSVELPAIMDIKWDYAISILGQKELALTAAKDFYRGIPGLIEHLNTLYRRIHEPGGADSYKIAVHGSKGVCNTFGAVELGAICRLLEFAAKAENYSRVDVLHPILIEELNRVIADWSELKDSEIQKEILEDMDGLLDLIRNMKEALEAFDLDQADEISEALSEYSYDETLQPLIVELINAVKDIDDAKGVELCTRIEEIIECQ